MLFDSFFHVLIKYSCYLTHKSYKMVDNKSLIRHIQEKLLIVIFIGAVFFLYMSFGKFPIIMIINDGTNTDLEQVLCPVNTYVIYC